MKEEVKITVIATGFKNDLPQRRDRGFSSIQTAISSARTATAYQPPQVTVASRVVAAPIVRAAAPTRETPSLATMTEAIRSTVEPDDLDVPAFIRKRGEVN